MRGRIRSALAAALLAVTLTGCATFPDDRPRPWQEQLDGAGELGGIPRVPEAGPPEPRPPGGSAPPTAPMEPLPCSDPDPAVVATCLDPVSAVAVLPDGETALVAERSSGRVVRVRQGTEPVEIVTVPVDSTAGGGLTGLALSPSYAEDRLAYAYITTPQENQVVLLAGSAPPRTILGGIPRSDRDNGGALAFDVDGSLLVATGEVGDSSTDPGSLAGKLLRINARGEPAAGNPDPESPVLSSGLQAPGGICVNSQSGAAWVTDRRSDADALHRVVPGNLPAPAWRWPDRPGVGGCAAQRDDSLQRDIIAVSQAETRAIALFRTSQAGAIVNIEDVLADKYGRYTAATLAPDGLIWVGTGNKKGGTPVPTDDRVIRLPPFAEGGASVVSHHRPKLPGWPIHPIRLLKYPRVERRLLKIDITPANRGNRMKHLQGLTVAVLILGLVGVGTPGIASAAEPGPEQSPSYVSLQGECFVERCAPGESAAEFEDLFSYIAGIPDSVLMAGDAATNEYVRANPRNGNSQLVSTTSGQPDPLRCVASVGTVLVSVLVPAAKLLKIKKLIRDVGGVGEAVRLLVGATSAAEKTEALSVALGALVGELLGIAGIRDTCFA